jgi:hypothetical protein
MKRALWLVGALILAIVPVGYANAVPSPITVSISGFDPNKASFDLVTSRDPITHQRVSVYAPKPETATCVVSPPQTGAFVSYTWTTERPDALDQPATVFGNAQKLFISWTGNSPLPDSFLTCHAAIKQDGVVTELSSSVYISHDNSTVRLKIGGVPIDSTVSPGQIATCWYTQNTQNSAVDFTWSVSAHSDGSQETPLAVGATFTFDPTNLALLKYKYLICRAHSGVAPYYLDNMAAALIADRTAFRPADPGKSTVTYATTAFNLQSTLIIPNSEFGIDTTTTGTPIDVFQNLTLQPNQVIESHVPFSVDPGLQWIHELVYDANGRLVTLAVMTPTAPIYGYQTWGGSWTVPKATTIYASGTWTIKLVASRKGDLQIAPTVTLGTVQVAGLIGTQIACNHATGTISTQSITATTYC